MSEKMLTKTVAAFMATAVMAAGTAHADPTAPAPPPIPGLPPIPELLCPLKDTQQWIFGDTGRVACSQFGRPDLPSIFPPP